jgi:hypothetical protein
MQEGVSMVEEVWPFEEAMKSIEARWFFPHLASDALFPRDRLATTCDVFSV